VGRNFGRTLWIHSGRGEMKAFFAVFLEFREGKIIRQRNYDCLKAW
jgi:ketosteroid isomerase-like protein